MRSNFAFALLNDNEVMSVDMWTYPCLKLNVVNNHYHETVEKKVGQENIYVLTTNTQMPRISSRICLDICLK
jgi:hypothetical protein